MVDHPFRHEVSNLIRACEHLISVTKMPGETKLSEDECQVVDYYAAELSKATIPTTIENQLTLKLF